MKKIQKCTYCNKKADSSDHCPPKFLFPKPRPDNLVTVPACIECNNSPSKDEEYFMVTFMFTKIGISISEKNKLERILTKNKPLGGKIAQEIRQEENGIYINPKADRINNVITKIVKGLHYIEYKETINSSQKIECHFVDEEGLGEIVIDYIPMLKPGSKKWEGIFEYSYDRTENNLGSMWFIKLFNQAAFFVICSNKELDKIDFDKIPSLEEQLKDL